MRVVGMDTATATIRLYCTGCLRAADGSQVGSGICPACGNTFDLDALRSQADAAAADDTN